MIVEQLIVDLFDKSLAKDHPQLLPLENWSHVRTTQVISIFGYKVADMADEVEAAYREPDLDSGTIEPEIGIIKKLQILGIDFERRFENSLEDMISEVVTSYPPAPFLVLFLREINLSLELQDRIPGLFSLPYPNLEVLRQRSLDAIQAKKDNDFPAFMLEVEAVINIFLPHVDSQLDEEKEREAQRVIEEGIQEHNDKLLEDALVLGAQESKFLDRIDSAAYGSNSKTGKAKDIINNLSGFLQGLLSNNRSYQKTQVLRRHEQDLHAINDFNRNLSMSKLLGNMGSGVALGMSTTPIPDYVPGAELANKQNAGMAGEIVESMVAQRRRIDALARLKGWLMDDQAMLMHLSDPSGGVNSLPETSGNHQDIISNVQEETDLTVTTPPVTVEHAQVASHVREERPNDDKATRQQQAGIG